MTTKELIVEITKSLIAIMVTVGAGYAILTQNSGVALIAGTLGVIIGYYFNRSTTPTNQNGSQ